MADASVQFARETDGGGSFQRQTSSFRQWVTADGADGTLPAAPGRYHLYVSLACPWAHRAVVVRKLKGLEDVIGLTVVDPIRDDEPGWVFMADEPDPLHGWSALKEGYLLSDPGYDARVTVPVLWDKETDRLVNNESADVIVMLNEAWDAWATHPEVDLYPSALRAEVDALNAWVYDDVNNGVYKSGFARTQEAYEAAVRPLFAGLDRLDARLAEQRYLVGDQLTLADVRLFTTLVRFDAVYVGHFKCNVRRIADYAHLSGYLRDVFQHPGVAETVDLDHIKRHYYATHPSINPSRIVPIGPELDLDAPHGRG